jgi:Cu-Zn family superoxide dismutase
VVALLAWDPAVAATVKAQVALTTAAGPGAGIGTVTFTDTPSGAHIQVALHDLPPGEHAFHVHANASCEPGTVNGATMAAGGAGPHYDAAIGGSSEGQVGDLPPLTVDSDGSDRETLRATGITDVAQLKDRALVIQVTGGDGRLACGVIR